MKISFILYLVLAGIMSASLNGQDTLPPQPEIEVEAPAEETPLPQEEIVSAVDSLPSLPADGYWVDNAPLNEVFQYLARKAGRQYFFNNEISTPAFNLTGHLRLEEPIQQMEDIAVAFGLRIHTQGATVYVMNQEQLATLPVEVMSYQLKYLRGSRPTLGSTQGGAEGGGEVPEFEKLKTIIQPMLTEGVGQIEFEEKTNTLLVTDNSVKLERLRELLERIDQPKPQIAVNVRVLRVSNSAGHSKGVDWQQSLGNGISVAATQNLNAMFNLPDVSVRSRASTRGTGGYTNSINRESIYQDGPGLVFGSVQVQAIVHALEQGDLVSQEACPTIITEDNEQGMISIVDRFPIITSTVSETTAGQSISEEVRYQIDEKDPDAMEDPEKSREIGVTLSVTPTLLPDGTIRMKLRPRVAKIVELIPGAGGNSYPRVSESTVEAISRVPNGKSLMLGGFYDYSSNDAERGVPILGKVPLLNLLFNYDQKTVERVSLVFIITPTAYDASADSELDMINEETRLFSDMEQRDLYELSDRLINEDTLEYLRNREANGDLFPKEAPQQRRSYDGKVAPTVEAETEDRSFMQMFVAPSTKGNRIGTRR